MILLLITNFLCLIITYCEILETCQSSMEMVTRPTTFANDGFGWRCANQRCPKRRTYRTIRAGLFFERSRIALDKWVFVTCLWSQ
jgi:hypothetical protein